VVLNNQPQGGLAMRQRPADVVARRNPRDEDGFGFDRWRTWDSYKRQRGDHYYYPQPQGWW
jgi:hypothetical protein